MMLRGGAMWYLAARGACHWNRVVGAIRAVRFLLND